MATIGAFCDLRVFGQLVQQRVVGETAVRDVGDEHGRLGGDQAQRLDQQHFVGVQAHRAHRLGVVQVRHHAFHDGQQLGRVLVARAGFLVFAVDRFFHGAHVGQRQFGLDDFDIVERVDLAGHVDHVVIFEAAHDVDDGVGFADVRQELVAQALAFRRASHQAGDVDELDDGVDHAFRLDDGGQRIHARVRHFDHADVRLDGAERIVFSRDAGFRQRIEQGGLADVRQADDTALETHEKPLIIKAQ